MANQTAQGDNAGGYGLLVHSGTAGTSETIRVVGQTNGAINLHVVGGTVVTSGAGTVNTGTIVGNVAHNAADSGNPVKIGGVYNSSAPTLDSGDRGDTQLDVNANVKVTNATLLAGEDLTNNVMGVVQKPLAVSAYAPSEYTNFGAGTGAAVKTSAGAVYSVYVTSGTAAVRYFQLFNGTSTPAVGGTPVASYPMGSVPAGGLSVLQLDTTHFAPYRYFSTGIAWAMSSTQGTLGTASVTAADLSVHIKYL